MGKPSYLFSVAIAAIVMMTVLVRTSTGAYPIKCEDVNKHCRFVFARIPMGKAACCEAVGKLKHMMRDTDTLRYGCSCFHKFKEWNKHIDEYVFLDLPFICNVLPFPFVPSLYLNCDTLNMGTHLIEGSSSKSKVKE